MDDLNKNTVESFLTMMATAHAHKCLVEHMAVGDNGFDNTENTQWPNTRLDGIVANYFCYFREYYLPEYEPQDGIAFKAALKILDQFLKAIEENNEKDSNELGAKWFDARVDSKGVEYLEHASIMEKETELLCSMSSEERENILKSEKSIFVLQEILTKYRRSLAEVHVEYSVKCGTLEEYIDSIIYATILITENNLKEAGLDISELACFWRNCGFFCNMWFAATFPDESGKSKTIRECFIEMSEKWPDYIGNACIILDYAAIIQDRLFSNRHMNPEIDWRTESFRVWNAYSAAALRLGEIYIKYKNHLPFMDKDIAIMQANMRTGKPLVITEGKTDWKHIKNALRCFKDGGEYQQMDLEFLEYEDNMGNMELLRRCKEYAKLPQSRPMIFIADRDNHDVVKQLGAPINESFRRWGNNVFSFVIPTPSHREGYKNISIEFYYYDKDIGHIDAETNRRLLFSNEVSEIIIKNKTYGSCQRTFHECDKIVADEYDKKIYDDKCDQVTNLQGKKVAHSKSVFAENVYTRRPGYDNFDLSEFALILNIIRDIISA